MPLEKLQNEIDELLAFDQDVGAISRNLFLYYGKNLVSFERFFHQYEFPVTDESFSSFWRWLDLDGQENLDESIRKTLLDLISLQTAGEALEKRGLQLITHTIQIFIIIDLPTSEASTKLQTILHNLDEIIESLQIEPVIAKIGILISSRIMDETLIHISVDDFETLYQEIKHRFDYLFFLQCQNEQSLFIKSDEEWVSLISNLLFYLAMFPSRFEAGKFREWIKRHQPSQHGISAVSATSYTLPMTGIIQYVLLSKGSDLLKETYFQIEDRDLEEAARGKVANLMRDSHCESAEQFSNALLEDSTAQIVNPLPVLDNLSSNLTSKKIVDIYRTVIQNVDSYLNHNKSILHAKAIQFYGEYEYSLIGTLDQVLNSYKGAAVICRKIMGDITEHLYQQLEKSKRFLSTHSTEDIAKELENLKAEADHEPPLIATVLRLIPFAFFSILLVFQILEWNTSYQKVLLFGIIILSLGVIALAFILRHAWKNRFVNKLIHLRVMLDRLWQQRLEYVGSDLYNDLLPKYIEKANSVKEDIEELNNRLEYLFNYIGNYYQPIVHPQNIFWINVLKEKSEMNYFFQFVNDEYVHQEPETVIEEKLLKLWWRLGNREELNPLEWEILEKAAMRLIPYSHDLIKYSICDYLNDNVNKKREILNQLQQCYLPFITLDPNRKGSTFDCGVLEWRKESCRNQSVIEDAKNLLNKNIGRIELIDAITHFRFYVLYFKEGINHESIRI